MENLAHSGAFLMLSNGLLGVAGAESSFVLL